MEIFINKIYPFFPVIEISDNKDSLNKFPPLLLNAIFLVASRCLPQNDNKDNNNNNNQPIRERCQELFERCKLLELCENNKIALIQSFLLMSIHEEGINGSSLSKEYITRACNLCGDLGITTLSGSNGTAVQDTQHRVYKKLYYDKSILIRLFWISYACDILSASTHAREVYYNMNDVFIDDVPKEFPELIKFVELLTLLYRTLGSHYRPHKGRIIDEKLFTDIQNWNSLVDHPWLKLLYSDICMINLRCEVDPITLDPQLINSLQIQFDNVANIDPFWFKFHIVGVHSLLHVTSLLNLLGNNDENLDTNNKIKTRLEDLKEIWWLAASGLKLFGK